MLDGYLGSRGLVFLSDEDFSLSYRHIYIHIYIYSPSYTSAHAKDAYGSDKIGTRDGFRL